MILAVGSDKRNWIYVHCSEFATRLALTYANVWNSIYSFPISWEATDGKRDFKNVVSGMGCDGRMRRISGLTRQTAEYVCRIPSQMTEKHSFLEKFLQKHKVFLSFFEYVCRFPSQMTEKHSILEKFLQKHQVFLSFF